MKWKHDIRLVFVLTACLGTIVFWSNSVKADFTVDEPTNLGSPINCAAHDYDPSISTDTLELYFVSERGGGYGGRDIWKVTRDSVSDLWAVPVNLGPTVNTAYNECCADISSDGLSLFFWSNRPGGSGGPDLWVTTRETLFSPWEMPMPLGPTVNSPVMDGGPSISVDGLSLVFFSERPGGSGGGDLWITTRATVSDYWREPVNLGPTVNSPANEATPDISSDGLAIFFMSTRPGGYGESDIWVTTRTTLTDPWAHPVNLGPTVNSPAADFSPNISADSSILLFTSDRSGGVGEYDTWQAAIEPIVDFNVDELIDLGDLEMLINNWGTDDKLYDIGPMPWGDGIVDVEDLRVFITHWEKENMLDSQDAQ